MTITSFATAGQPGAAADPLGYRPGVCNIGPEEIARRRRAGHVGLAITLALFAILVVIDAPPLARLMLVLPAAAAASGYLQAWLRFCAGFGSMGVFNLGPVGHTEAVTDPEARARDRRRAREIVMASFEVGVGVGVVAVLLPL